MLSEVAPGVWVTTSAVLATTSTVVVDADGAAAVVDPGVTAAERAALARAIGDHGWHVVAGLATHAHWDHLLWWPSLGGAPRWALPATVDASRAHRSGLLAELEGALGPADPSTVAGFAAVRAVEVGPLPGLPHVVVLGHDAHCAGHAAALVPAARTLVAGDMLSDVEVPLLDLSHRTPLAAYVDGLALLRMVLDGGGVDVVVPGHGSVADRAEARRRLDLDEEYLTALAAGRPPDDPRLHDAPGWLVDAHREQVAAVAAGDAR